MSDKILKITSRYIYDSRGNPTVEVDLWTSKGTYSCRLPQQIATFFFSFVRKLKIYI